MAGKSKIRRLILWALAVFIVIIPVLAVGALGVLRLVLVNPPAPEPVPIAQFDAGHLVHFPSLAPPRIRLWGMGAEAEGYLFRPAGNGPFPAVVMLHGCSGFHSLAGYRRWVDRLVSWGYVVLVVDGLSWRGAWLCMEIHRITPQGYAGDAYGGLRFLAAQPYVAADRVGLMGWSYGGVTLLMAVESGAGIHDAATLAKTYPDLGPLRFKAAVGFYPASFSTTTRFSVPLLMLVGELDGMGNADRLRLMAEHGRNLGDPTSLHVYPGAFHGFDAETPWDVGLMPLKHDPAATTDAAERVKAFLAENLK
jgi:dienelactone hydrolase